MTNPNASLKAAALGLCMAAATALPAAAQTAKAQLKDAVFFPLAAGVITIAPAGSAAWPARGGRSRDGPARSGSPPGR